MADAKSTSGRDNFNSLRRFAWLAQGVLAVLAAVTSIGLLLWGMASHGYSTLGFLIFGACVLANVASAYYFISRIKQLLAIPHNATRLELFLQEEYNWAIGAWCVIIASGAYAVNALVTAGS